MRADGLQRVCLHEYAHLAAARHFGACGFVSVLRIVGAAVDDRYAGRFQMFGELADAEWRIVALAGAVAECLSEDHLADAAGVLRRLDASPALLCGVDRDLAGQYTPADVETCIAILQEAWTTIRADADAHESRVAANRPS